MQQIVECVPNFSNGRDPQVFQAIAAAIRSVRGTNVLDVSADRDHNRTVITFVGSPAAVEEAAYQGIKRAAQLINLDQHKGEHPRIGATDVCPFIPIKGVTSSDCVAIAQRLGKRVGEELGIAVYLYGKAATRPEREKLATIRQGQYELWKKEIGNVEERAPDFGPAVARPWGATVIGVRPFLIAYNIYLNSEDVEIADKIARQIRFVSGGLRFVQAKGFLVGGKAQVSMNLTDFERTPLHRVQELVRRETARYGLAITRAELVGLTPQKALMDAARWYLQLDDLVDNQVLELRLTEEAAIDPAPYDFVEATAAKTPTPGGGSAAALAGALGAALTQMVSGLTVGRQKYAAVNDQAQQILESAAALREALSQAISEDSAAFEALIGAMRNKVLDEQERAAAIESATLWAAEVPLKVAQKSLEAARLAQKIAEIGNSNAATDAAAGAILAGAAVNIAALNVRANVTSLQDRERAKMMRTKMLEIEQRVAEVIAAVKTTAAERGGY